jgi:hypothetical protein
MALPTPVSPEQFRDRTVTEIAGETPFGTAARVVPAAMRRIEDRGDRATVRQRAKETFDQQKLIWQRQDDKYEQMLEVMEKDKDSLQKIRFFWENDDNPAVAEVKNTPHWRQNEWMLDRLDKPLDLMERLIAPAIMQNELSKKAKTRDVARKISTQVFGVGKKQLGYLQRGEIAEEKEAGKMARKAIDEGIARIKARARKGAAEIRAASGDSAKYIAAVKLAKDLIREKQILALGRKAEDPYLKNLSTEEVAVLSESFDLKYENILKALGAHLKKTEGVDFKNIYSKKEKDESDFLSEWYGDEEPEKKTNANRLNLDLNKLEGK